MIEEEIRNILSLEEQTGMDAADIIALMQVKALNKIVRKEL